MSSSLRGEPISIQLGIYKADSYESAKVAILSAELEDIYRGRGRDAPQRSARTKSRYATAWQPTGVLRESSGGININPNKNAKIHGKSPCLRGILSEARQGRTLGPDGHAAGVGTSSSNGGGDALESQQSRVCMTTGPGPNRTGQKSGLGPVRRSRSWNRDQGPG